MSDKPKPSGSPSPGTPLPGSEEFAAALDSALSSLTGSEAPRPAPETAEVENAETAAPAEAVPRAAGASESPEPAEATADSAPPEAEPAPAPLTLAPHFPGAEGALGRMLPRGAAVQLGVQVAFAELPAYFRWLFEEGFSGHLHIGGEASWHVLMLEGRPVNAAAPGATGELALAEFCARYAAGEPLAAYRLPRDLAHALSGVGAHPLRVTPGGDFTGVHSAPHGTTFYQGGQAVARVPQGLPAAGGFPALARPQALRLPRESAAWAHRAYRLTLRGRDALSPIMPAHDAFRQRHGPGGLALLRALHQGMPPAEYAQLHGTPPGELEASVAAMISGGYLQENAQEKA